MAVVRDQFVDRARYAALRISVLRPPVRVSWLCRTRLMLSWSAAPHGCRCSLIGFFSYRSFVCRC